MKAPKAVCTSARQKVNQSRPMRLRRDGVVETISASSCSGAGHSAMIVALPAKSARALAIRTWAYFEGTAWFPGVPDAGGLAGFAGATAVAGAAGDCAPKTTTGSPGLYSGATRT